MASFKVPGMDYQPTGGDKSIELLRSLFGGTVDGIGGALGPLSDVLYIFNGAILALASVLGFVLIAQAVIGTAHDGSVLGKRFSSLWVPIRTVGAAALLVPAVGGFSGIQLLVLSLAVQGVGLGDRMTSAGVDAVLNKGLVKPAAVATKTGEELSKGMIQIAACMSANERLNGLAGQSVPSYVDPRRTAKGAVTVDIGLDYTSVSDGVTVRHSCGSLTIGKNQSDSERFAAAADTMQAAQIEAAMAMYRKAKEATDAIVTTRTGTTADYSAQRAAMVKAHDDALNDALEAAMSRAMAAGSREHEKAIQQIKQEGWLALGGASFKLASISSEISANVKLGQVEASPNSHAASRLEEDAYRGEVAGIINRMNLNADAKVPQANEDKDKGWLSGLTQKLANEAIEMVTERMFSIIKSFTTSGTGNPLLDVKAQGDFLLNAGVAVGIAAVLLAIPAAALNASLVVLAVAFPFVMLLVTLGATMAIWVPMIPYITFISVAVAWLVMLVESVVASGLWLLLWFSGEKDGIVAPGGEQGVRFLASVLLMPALTVIAFFAASIIIIGLGGWVSATFSDVVRSMNSTNLGAVVLVLGVIALYMATMISLVSKVFSMCLTMPATVLKWIGGGFTGAESIEKGVEGQNNAIIAPITSFTSNAAPKRMARSGGGQGAAGSGQGSGEGKGNESEKASARPRVTNEPE